MGSQSEVIARLAWRNSPSNGLQNSVGASLPGSRLMKESPTSPMNGINLLQGKAEITELRYEGMCQIKQNNSNPALQSISFRQHLASPPCTSLGKNPAKGFGLPRQEKAEVISTIYGEWTCELASLLRQLVSRKDQSELSCQ
jgi:hypothetical protein